MSKIFVIFLIAISSGVAGTLLLTHTPPWNLVCLYWIVLTMKNFCDLERKEK